MRSFFRSRASQSRSACGSVVSGSLVVRALFLAVYQSSQLIPEG
ncbi:hypothetical protein [Devosia sp.]|nr:hypothetical protein [Devosia sp.]